LIWLALLLAQGAPDTARGEKIFAQNCSVGYCHGAAGAAGRGPRLRGRTFERNYLLQVTRDGIPNSAMPGWKGRLTEEDIQAVVSYVASQATVKTEAPPENQMPSGVGPAAVPAFKGPPEAERGYRLFFDATREENCGTCHSLGGRGIAIGPALAPKPLDQLLSAMRATQSRHVLTARLKNGEVFPALRAEQNEQLIKLYDLTVAPPVLRTLQRSEIESLTENPNWRHDLQVRRYAPAELAAIAAYIGWRK
jgi:cytochrome c55X